MGKAQCQAGAVVVQQSGAVAGRGKNVGAGSSGSGGGRQQYVRGMGQGSGSSVHLHQRQLVVNVRLWVGTELSLGECPTSRTTNSRQGQV